MVYTLNKVIDFDAITGKQKYIFVIPKNVLCDRERNGNKRIKKSVLLIILNSVTSFEPFLLMFESDDKTCKYLLRCSQIGAQTLSCTQPSQR
jgi:hypothetical protein